MEELLLSPLPSVDPAELLAWRLELWGLASDPAGSAVQAGSAAGVAASSPPPPAAGETNLIKNVFLPLSLGVIMFGMGLTLTVADFRRVAARPQAVATGLALQLVGLPVVALAVVWLFGLSGWWAVGLLLVAFCPGGTTSNFVTHLARGDTALSISMTAVNSLITVFTIPLFVGLALTAFIGQTRPVEVDALTMMAQIFGVTAVPVLLGMALRGSRGRLADRLEVPIRRLSVVLFTVIVLGAVLKEKDKVASAFAQIGAACVLLNALGMALGYGVAKLLRFDHPQSIALGVEVGIQNATLAIVLATSSLNVDLLSFPAAVYGLAMFATAGVFGWLVNRRAPAPVPAQ